jgi:hypothetical protein
MCEKHLTGILWYLTKVHSRSISPPSYNPSITHHKLTPSYYRKDSSAPSTFNIHTPLLPHIVIYFSPSITFFTSKPSLSVATALRNPSIANFNAFARPSINTTSSHTKSRECLCSSRSSLLVRHRARSFGPRWRRMGKYALLYRKVSFAGRYV